MKPELKEKWIDAMLSGEYNQTTGTLCRKDENGELCFCPMGLVLHLTNTGEWYERNEGYDIQAFRTFGEHSGGGIIDETLRKLIGIERSQMAQIIHMNDIRRLEWSDIVKYIKEAV